MKLLYIDTYKCYYTMNIEQCTKGVGGSAGHSDGGEYPTCCAHQPAAPRPLQPRLQEEEEYYG